MKQLKSSLLNNETEELQTELLISLLSGDDQQSGVGVLGGAPAGFCGRHGKHTMVNDVYIDGFTAAHTLKLLSL